MVKWAGYDPVDVYLKPLPWYPGCNEFLIVVKK